jgi:hypothetical protein
MSQGSRSSPSRYCDWIQEGALRADVCSPWQLEMLKEKFGEIEAAIESLD